MGGRSCQAARGSRPRSRNGSRGCSLRIVPLASRQRTPAIPAGPPARPGPTPVPSAPPRATRSGRGKRPAPLRPPPSRSPRGARAARGPPRPSPRVLALLALLCAFSLCVRWIGADWMLPHHEPLDGLVIERQIAIYRYPQAGDEQDQSYAYYPHLSARLVAALPELRAALPDRDSPEAQLARAGADWLEFRRMSAVLTTLLLLATWLLARRFVGERWALLASALVGTS